MTQAELLQLYAFLTMLRGYEFVADQMLEDELEHLIKVVDRELRSK